MKKYLIAPPLLATLLFTSLFMIQTTHAGACFGETSADYYVKVKSGVNMRDAVCEGNVIDTLSAGLVVHVVGDLDGWVQVEYNGKVGFVWGDFVETTNAPTAPTDPNPTPTDPDPVPPAPGPEPKDPLWDVGNHQYKDAIWNLYNEGIVSGNDDDKSYEPDEKINRAAFAKIAILANFDSVPVRQTGCLNDVSAGQWYTDVICFANETLIDGEPLIKGHPSGDFLPADNIRFSELSKIVALLYDLEIGEGVEWYEGYINALEEVNAIPIDIKTPEHFVTRAQMAEIIDRLILKDSTRPSAQFNYLVISSGENPMQDPVETTNEASDDLNLCVNEATPLNIDYEILRSKALELTNQARIDRGLNLVNQSDVLDATSQQWVNNGQFTHDRPGGLDFGEHLNSLGVTAYTSLAENLGQHSFTCQTDDCTTEALAALESIHQSFMDEEGLPDGQDGHFKNITGDYEVMGFGFSQQEEQMMFVFQYGSGIQGDAEMLCENLQ